MAYPITIKGLTPREAVADALHRSMLGFDTNERSLLESAFVKDEDTSIVLDKEVVQGWTAMEARIGGIFALVSTHVISNVRVVLEDNDHPQAASMTAHAIAYHIRPDEVFTPEDSSYTNGTLYSMNLVKDAADGLWKIKKWEIQRLWTSGDRAIVYGH